MRYSKLKYVISSNFVLIIFLTSIVSAAPTQWFPTENTTIDYNVQNVITLNDGTKVKSSLFHVVNYSENWVFLIPSYYLDINDEVSTNFNGKFLKNNTEVLLRREYSEDSITHLSRKTSLIVNQSILTPDVVYLIRYMTSNTWNALSFQLGNEELIKKNDFDYSVNEFFDYVDNSVGIGIPLGTGFSLIAEVENSLIISDTDNIGTYNMTIIADLTGKVSSYTVSFIIPSLLGFSSTSYSFYVPSSSSNEIPSFPTYLLIGLVVIVSGIIVSKSKKKKL